MTHHKTALSTQIVHSTSVDKTGFESLHTPVYRGSSTFFANTAAQRAPVDALGLDYSYGLHGNPTQYSLAKKLAEIEGAQHCIVCPSGLSAIALVAQGCLQHGDHWLIPSNVYGPAQLIAIELKQSSGIEFTEYDPCNLANLDELMQANTKLVWVEAPGSLTFELPDIAQLSASAKKQGALLAIDNTWSAGIAFKPFEHGFDFSIQALTKYQCGHADVLMGAVLGNKFDTFAKIERKNRLFGLGVSPSDCELVIRGLLTLPLRYQVQAENGLKIAQELVQHKAVDLVLHPALPGCPGHVHYQKYFTGCASVFSFVLKPQYSDSQACAVVDALKYFRIAYSWGGPESLALVVNVPQHRRKGQGGSIIRLAIGLESPEDLLLDLNQALGNLDSQSA